MAASEPRTSRASAIPQAVRDAYVALPEDAKKAISQATHERNPALFIAWMRLARLNRGLREKTVATRRSPYGHALDRVLLDDRHAGQTANVLSHYFAAIDTRLNETFMAAMRERGFTETAGSRDAAEEVLSSLSRTCEPRLFALFSATLLWLAPGWFESSANATPAPRVLPVGEHEASVDNASPDSVEQADAPPDPEDVAGEPSQDTDAPAAQPAPKGPPPTDVSSEGRSPNPFFTSTTPCQAKDAACLATHLSDLIECGHHLRSLISRVPDASLRDLILTSNEPAAKALEDLLREVRTAQQRLAEQLKIVPTSCAASDCPSARLESSFCKILMATSAVTGSPPSELLRAADAASGLRNDLADATTSLQALESQRQELLGRLDRPAVPSNNTIPSWPALLATIETVKSETLSLQAELTDQLQLAQQRLSTRAEALRSRFHLEGSETEKLDSILSALSRARGLRDVRLLDTDLADLEDCLSPTHLALSSAVRNALEPALAPTALPYIPLLAATQRSWEAGLLSLYVIQHSPSSNLSSAERSAFLRAYVDTLCYVPDEALRRLSLSALLSPDFSPWLAALAPEDLSNPTLAIELSALLVATAESSEELYALAFQFEAFETLRRLDHPQLRRLSECIRTRTPYRFVAPVSASGAPLDRQSIDSEINSSFTYVVRLAGPLRSFLYDEIRPKLRALWKEARSVAATSRSHEAILATGRREVDRLIRRELDIPFFLRKVNEEVDRIVDLMRARIAESSPVSRDSRTEIDSVALFNELQVHRSAAGSNSTLWDIVATALLRPRHLPLVSVASAIHALACETPEAFLYLPELPLRWASENSVLVTDADLPLLLARLDSPLTPADSFSRLRDGGCLHQAALLAHAFDLPARDQTSAELADATAARETRLKDLSSEVTPGEHSDLSIGIQTGAFEWVDGRLDSLNRKRQQTLQGATQSLDSRLRALREEIRRLQDAADESPHDLSWRENTHKALDVLLTAVASAVATQAPISEKEGCVRQIERALPTLQTHIQHDGHDFTLLHTLLLDPYAAPATPSPAPVLTEPDFRSLPDSYRLDAEAFWASFLALESLADSSPAPTEAIAQCQRLFAKGMDMYHAQADTADGHTSVAIHNLRYHATESAFRRPGSNFFDRRIRIYTSLPGGLGLQSLGPIRDDIRKMHIAGKFAILLSLRDPAEVRAHLAAEVRDGLVTVLDRGLLLQFLSSKNPRSPLRQAMRRTTSVELASPFRSEGYVDRNQHLFVQRRHLLTRLSNGACWTIWGGRRSGKTSLLHDVGHELRAKRLDYRIEYRSMETLPALSTDRLDEHVASMIGRALGWPDSASALESFADRLREHCHREPVCLLLDEMDAYIRPHLDSGSRTFPVIKQFRGIRNELKDRFVCIFAGFKYLYRAVKLVSEPKDSTYPWVNWLESTEPLGQLTLRETSALVHEGFEDVLGLTYEATVPGLIFEKTAGHPAFVQYFCHSILQRLVASGRQNQARVTEAEVEAVYNDAEGLPGSEPFVRFVQRTLDMNLSELERIVVYAFADLAKEAGANQLHPRAQLESYLSDLFNFAGVAPPSSDSLETAFRYLHMTNMLRIEGSSLGMSFPSYVNILRRLERTDRTLIFDLIRALPAAGHA